MEGIEAVIGRVIDRLADRLDETARLAARRTIIEAPVLADGRIDNGSGKKKGPSTGECAGTELARQVTAHGEVSGIPPDWSPAPACQRELNTSDIGTARITPADQANGAKAADGGFDCAQGTLNSSSNFDERTAIPIHPGNGRAVVVGHRAMRNGVPGLAHRAITPKRLATSDNADRSTVCAQKDAPDTRVRK